MPTTAVTAPKPKKKTVVEVLKKEVGVREEGGNNRGPRVEEYLRSVGLGPGQPWCASFIHWGYRQTGDIKKPERPFAAALAWHPSSKRIWDRKSAKDSIAVGDHFSLYFSNLGRIGHTGMVVGVDEKYVTTVEGNTSSDGGRDGSGVYLRKRLKKSLFCVSRW